MVFAFVGGSGSAILFICFLALWAVFVGLTLVTVAHCYQVVVQGTVAGLDVVKWPDDHLYDWLPQSAAFLGLVAIWMIPVGLLSRGLAGVWWPENHAARTFVLAGLVLWFFFPLSLLSSLGSQSRWTFLNGRVLLELLRFTPSLILFYLITAGLIGVVGWLGYFGLFSSAWYAFPVGMILGSMTVLVHARLVGRLGWMMLEHRRSQEKAAKRQRSAKRAKRRQRDQAAQANQEESVERASNRYQAVEVPEPPPPRPHWMDPEPEPYTLAEPRGEESTTPAAPRLQLNEEQVQRELELRLRKPPNPPPQYPMFSGVWTFPFYSETAQYLLYMSMWMIAMGFCFHMMQTFFPG